MDTIERCYTFQAPAHIVDDEAVSGLQSALRARNGVTNLEDIGQDAAAEDGEALFVIDVRVTFADEDSIFEPEDADSGTGAFTCVAAYDF